MYLRGKVEDVAQAVSLICRFDRFAGQINNVAKMEAVGTTPAAQRKLRKFNSGIAHELIRIQQPLTKDDPDQTNCRVLALLRHCRRCDEQIRHRPIEQCALNLCCSWSAVGTTWRGVDDAQLQ